MAGDGWLFLQNSWRGMEGMGDWEDSWECLFLCATHWYRYINSLIAVPTLNWISEVSGLRDQGHSTTHVHEF